MGPGLEALEARALLAADITVLGGADFAQTIVSGDATPSLTDFTDLGRVDLGGASTSWTFRIKNEGDAPLSLNATANQRVTISGANASDFTVSTNPSSATINAGLTSDFAITFNPSGFGTRTATVTITSNDPDEASYTFTIQGTGDAHIVTGATEDQANTITFANLFAATHEGSPSQTGKTFRVESVQSGTLKKDGVDVTPGVTTLAAGQSLSWTPPSNQNRTIDAFTIRLLQDGVATGEAIPIRVEVAGVGDAPIVSSPIPDVNVDAGTTSHVIDLLDFFSDPDLFGKVVRYSTTLGTIDVGLFGDRTPANVANFLGYVNRGDYNNTIIHRSVDDFVIQGGGFLPSNNQTHIPTVDPVLNEFGVSSLRGTIAMAKTGNNPDSATSEWFFNLSDNSQNLDNQNGGFTAFGEVINGMSVVDAIAAVQTFNRGGAFTNLPLQNFTSGTPGDANFIKVNSIAEIPGFTFSLVSNSNDDLVATTFNADGTLRLDFTPGLSGTAEIRVRATDLSGESVETTFTVEVDPGPVALADSVATRSGQPVIIDVLANDSDATGTLLPNTVAVTQNPTKGTFSIDPANGRITYTPNVGATGNDTFKYTVTNNHGVTSPTATVTVTINRLPSVANDAATTTMGQAVVIDVLANDADLDGALDFDSVIITDAPENGAFTIDPANGKVTYTPNAGFTGTDTFKYTVNDNQGDTSAEATVTVTVEALVIAIGDGAARSVTFTDADGTVATISIKGGGTGTLKIEGEDIAQTTTAGNVTLTGTNLRLVDVTLADTNIKSTLTISTKAGDAGDAFIDVDSITNADPMKSITAKGVDLQTRLEATGGLTGLALHDVETAEIEVGPPIVGNANLTASFNDVKDSSFTSETPVKSLTANQWLNEAGDEEDFEAPILTKATIKGDFAADLRLTGLGAFSPTLGTLTVTGELDGNWDVTGNAKTISAASSDATWDADFSGDVITAKIAADMQGDLEARSLKTLTVGGDLKNSDLRLTQAVVAGNTKLVGLSKATVKGTIENTNLRATGHVGTVTAGAVHNSNLFAGVNTGVLTLPTLASQFPAQATFKTLKITGLADEPFDVINSNFAAWAFGAVSFLFAQTTPAGTEFGVAANSIKSLSYTDADGTDKLVSPAANATIQDNLVFKRIETPA